MHCVLVRRAWRRPPSTLTSAKAKATQLQQEITSTGQQIDALDQQYQAAEEQKASLDQQITTTQAKIGQTRQQVAGDRANLSKAAVNAYISTGSAATEDPLFSGSQTSDVRGQGVRRASPRATSAPPSPT